MQNRSYGFQIGTGGYERNSRNGQMSNAASGSRNNVGAPQRKVEIIETGNAQTGNAVIRCYNYNGKGHLANTCPKLRVRGSDFHKLALLLALKDEAGGTLTNNE